MTKLGGGIHSPTALVEPFTGSEQVALKEVDVVETEPLENVTI